MSVTVDDCAVAGLRTEIETFMKVLEARFRITRGGILKTTAREGGARE